MSKSGSTAAYRDLSRDVFDAIVTGELTHQAVWLETILETAIENYFAVPKDTLEAFGRLVFRDGMTFQTKIELVRSIISEGEFADEYKSAWKEALTGVEEIKRLRNAMAHGKDVGGHGLEMMVGDVNRSGKEVKISINPSSHAQCLAEGEKLQATIHKLAAQIRSARKVGQKTEPPN